MQTRSSRYLAYFSHKRVLLVLQHDRNPEDIQIIVDVTEDMISLLTIPTAHELLLQ